jgi:hypothetical protein
VIFGTAYGVLGGIVGAVVLDSALLAWRPVQSPAAASASEPAVAWRPQLLLGPARAELGVAGWF